MLVYLLRHGETDWNREHRLQGREDIPLNENGIAQTRAAKSMFQGLKLDYLLSSPLKRAVTTAEIISETVGLPITIEPGLTERDFAQLSGLPHKHINVFKVTDEAPEVEPIDAVADRVMSVIEKYPLDSSILLISHGGAINALLVRAFGTDENGPGRAVLKNLCLSCLEYDGKDFKVVFFNKNA